MYYIDPHHWFGVYLIIDSLLFYIDIMQKLLNTYFFAPCSQLWQRTLLTSKAGPLAALMLLLMGLAQPAAATAFYKDFVVLNSNYYPTNNQFGTRFQDAPLGSFDRGTGQLLIGGEANTETTSGDNLYTPQMYYRVYLKGTPTAAVDDIPFTPLTLNFQSSGEDGNPEKRKWSNTSNNSNLIASTSAAGTYVLEVYFAAYGTYNNSGGTGNFNIFDVRSPFVNYTATFEVTGEVPRTWNGTQGDDWFDQRNWTPNGLPNAVTDVTVRYIEGNRNYPSIRNLDPNNGAPAAVRNLTIEGRITTDSNGKTTTDVGGNLLLADTGELEIYGNFQDPNAGFNQTSGILTFAGSAQNIDGGSFSTVRLRGGKKSLSKQLIIRNSLTFADAGSIIETRTDDYLLYNVSLNLGARIIGESQSSYVSGFLRGKSDTFTPNSPSTFGDIGVEIKSASDYSKLVTATRRTGTSYTGTGPKNTSVTRSFSFDENINGINFDLAFQYFATELNGLNSSKFVLYRSENGARPFENLGSNSATSNTTTRQAITGVLAATFTVGEGVNPLPVTLVSFTAAPTAQGGALLRWNTATESNNKGFGIERQLTSGDAWQPVGYLATGNNAAGGTYEYTDKSLATAAFTPQAYYRLRQEDLNGKLSYSPVAVVSRSAVAASTSLLLSPVPVTGSNISLTFAEAGQAGSEISIINVQGQRLLHYTTQSSDAAALSLPVEQLAAGVYIVNVRVPGQALRHARFVKL